MDKYRHLSGLSLPDPHPIDPPYHIQTLAPPERIVIPLLQRNNVYTRAIVRVGERVLAGQAVTKGESPYDAISHSSISGKVIAIDEQVIPHPSQLNSLAITIESDGNDTAITPPESDDVFKRSPQELLQRIYQCGIVGLGGAGFPTHVKIGALKNCQTLIVNGTESEPGVMCDHALMQNQPEAIIAAIKVLLHISQAKQALFVMKENKTFSYNLLKSANDDTRIRLVTVPNQYTAGAEKLLIKRLLKLEVPAKQRAVHLGILCQNVSTVNAIYQAVVARRPLISRVMTLTGSAVQQSQNYLVRIGSMLEEVLPLTQLSDEEYTVRIGGMMMGLDMPHLNFPMTKTTNCVFVNQAEAKAKAQNCIRCGQCHQVCPIDLLPQQLYWHTKSEQIDKALQFNLLDCIECGCCSYVCPSNIPLVEYFQYGKALYKKTKKERQQAAHAKARYEFRELRVARDQAERAEMLERKRQELLAKMSEDTKQKDTIKQAMARVKKTKGDAEH